MKRFSLACSIVLVVNSLLAANNAAAAKLKKEAPVIFTENKGQVSDQFNQARPDVLFSGSTHGMVYHLRRDGVSYQLSRADKWKEVETGRTNETVKIPSQFSVYRLDLTWLGADKTHEVQTGLPLTGYNNYYLPGCPTGVHHVKSFSEVSYKGIYKGIDLNYYEKNGELEYDYIVAPHTSYKQIRLQVNGTTGIALLKNGDLRLETPFGAIIEKAPVAFQNGKILSSKWVITGNVVSFEIEKYNPAFSLIIDPVVRTWGTYYGGGGGEFGYGTCIDSTGNVFLSGWTSSSAGTVIATTGAHQTTYAGTGGDAYLVKFNSSGVRQWGTYYGGSGTEISQSCSTDGSGNVFMCGFLNFTLPFTDIATPGAFQTSYGSGTYDGFLIKFNSAGVRQWGTFYGGPADERAYGCTTASNGDVYLAGKSAPATGTALATPGAHQTAANRGFLARFDTNGNRIWGTYYGAGAQSCAVDANGFVYLAGLEAFGSSTAVATPGSHQPSSSGGSNDAYLAKFDGNGVRQWGTYYGGTGIDEGRTCAVDASGNVYLGGNTTSPTSSLIATAAAHQTAYAGGVADGFLVKFNSSGVRQWGTYYGGAQNDEVNGCSIVLGDVVVCGVTQSAGSVLATAASHQTLNASTVSNGSDGFLSKFTASGARDWGTYYGGTDFDYAYSCVADATGNIYMAGHAASSSGIATTGAHQAFGGGSTTYGMLAKFFDCGAATAPVNATPVSNATLCAGQAATLTAVASGTVNWYASPTSTTVINTGTSVVTPTLAAGTYAYYATTNDCPSAGGTMVGFTVEPNPVLTVSNGTVCAGDAFVINPLGAFSYSISGGSFTVSPNTTTTYSITGTSSVGCAASNTVQSTILVNPRPTILVNSGFICIGNSYSIQPGGAFTYTITGGSYNVSPGITTSYSITGTSAAGCVSSNTAVSTVVVNTVFPVVTVNSGSICAGQTFTLAGGGANTYQYSSGSPQVSPAASTNYTVTGTNTTTSCKATAISTVVVGALPVLSASVSPNIICAGATALVSADGASTYTWAPGVNSASFTASPAVTTIYTVTGAAANTCTGSATVMLTVDLCTALNSAAAPAGAIRIYPNPNAGEFVICQGAVNRPAELFLYNNLGQLVLSQQLHSENATIGIEHLAAGVYYLMVMENGKDIFSEKIMKE